MKVMVAPDSFKGSLTAVEAAEAMERGLRRVEPDAEVDVCPLSDGGEGFVETMLSASRGTLHEEAVLDPLGRRIRAAWALLDDGTAVIEVAAASGLTRLTPAERDPEATTSHGTGQLIAAALERGCTRLLIGLGGSATNDGGVGIAQALGVRFIDESDVEITSPIPGGRLREIAQIDLASRHPQLGSVRCIAACDVTNPLTGPSGAAAVYSPQKGATPPQVGRLDAGLAHLAQLLRTQLSLDLAEMPGAGAAGGIAAGLVAFAGARLRPGIGIALETLKFTDRVADCDLCITGEGQLDTQTRSGKAVAGVALAAHERGVPTIALVGRAKLEQGETLPAGIVKVWELVEGCTTEFAMQHAAALLADRAEAAVRAFRF